MYLILRLSLNTALIYIFLQINATFPQENILGSLGTLERQALPGGPPISEVILEDLR